MVPHWAEAQGMLEAWSKPLDIVGLSFFFFFKDLFIIISKYTVAVFRHSRRGRQISLRMVVSDHVVAGI
jgi:hypothetical protein